MHVLLNTLTSFVRLPSKLENVHLCQPALGTGTEKKVNKHYAAAQAVLDGKFTGNRKFSDACKAYGLDHKTQIKTVKRRYTEILDCGIEAAGGGRREVCVYTCARVLNVYIANNYIFICA